MYRWLFACLALALGLMTWQALRARDKNLVSETKAEKAFAALMKELDEAIDGADSKEAVAKVRRTFGKKLYAHARAYPTDKSAVEALLLTVRMTKPGDEGVRKDAVALLLKDHPKSPHLTKDLLGGLGSSFFDPDVGKFLQAVVKDNPDKTIRALTAKALIKARESAIELIGELNKKADLRKQIGGELGQAFVKNFIASEAAYKKEKADLLAKLRGELKGVIPDTMPGAVAPAEEATDLKGEKVKLSDYKGKVVVLDFWGTFCPPCIKMIPDSRKLVKAMKGKPFAFVSVSADEEKGALTDFLKEHQMPWDHWWVGSGSKFQKAWDVDGFPTVFVIDHKGVIRYSQVGYSEEDRIAKEAERLVKEAEADKKAEK
jgi:peroxiredoxin